jgi:hypothetical protein
VTDGDLIAKQLEVELKILNDGTWWWNAKMVNDKKYIMRFPLAKNGSRL